MVVAEVAVVVLDGWVGSFVRSRLRQASVRQAKGARIQACSPRSCPPRQGAAASDGGPVAVVYLMTAAASVCALLAGDLQQLFADQWTRCIEMSSHELCASRRPFGVMLTNAAHCPELPQACRASCVVNHVPSWRHVAIATYGMACESPPASEAPAACIAHPCTVDVRACGGRRHRQVILMVLMD